MKLKVLTCNLCEAPMRFENGKLICDYCGAVREIEKDASDTEYEQIANAEEHIRLSLERQKQEMEDYFAQEEQRQIEAEEEAARRERKRKIQERLRRLRRSLIRMGIIVAIIVAIGFLLKYMAQRRSEQMKTTVATTVEKEQVKKKDHVTKTDLLNDPQFLENTEKAALEQAKKVHYSNVIISSKEIWGLSGTPKLLESYLVTSENGNYLFFLYQSTLKTKAGDEKEVYNCIAVEDIEVSSDGKVSFNSRVYEEKAGEYDFYWRCSFDLEQLRGEVIDAKRNSVKRKYFIYQL